MLTKFLTSLIFTSAVSAATHHFKGDPYNDRSDISRRTNSVRYRSGETDEDSPHRGMFVYPNERGTYPLITVLGGMYGVVPEFGYEDIIDDLVRKGFVVMYSWSFLDDNTTHWETQFHWEQQNVNEILDDATRNLNHVQVDLTKQATWCNSAGCEIAKFYAHEYVEFFSAHYFFDPVLKDREIQREEIVTRALIAIDSTELCERCCLGKKDIEPLWNDFKSNDVKILETVNHAGHCSPLNTLEAKLCSRINFCVMDDDYNTSLKLGRLHNCTNAKMVAMYTDAFFNDPEMRDYYVNVNNHCSGGDYSPGYDAEVDATRCLGPNCSGF